MTSSSRSGFLSRTILPKTAAHFSGSSFGPPPPICVRSVRQRSGPHLDLDRLRVRLLASFVVEEGAGAGGGPQSLAFPAGVRIVDASIDVLGEHAHGVGDAQVDELAVDQ